MDGNVCIAILLGGHKTRACKECTTAAWSLVIELRLYIPGKQTTDLLLSNGVQMHHYTFSANPRASSSSASASGVTTDD